MGNKHIRLLHDRTLRRWQNAVRDEWKKKAEFKLYGSDPDYVNLNAIEEKKQAKRFRKC